ncbi:hypothetical protein Csa_002682, partial [Cucumis sativus]
VDVNFHNHQELWKKKSAVEEERRCRCHTATKNLCGYYKKNYYLKSIENMLTFHNFQTEIFQLIRLLIELKTKGNDHSQLVGHVQHSSWRVVRILRKMAGNEYFGLITKK